MQFSALVLWLRLFARQVRRYAYCVALLCGLCMILVALYFLGLVEKVFEGAI